MTKTIALVLVLFGCTRNNPNYVSDGSGTGTDGGSDGGTTPACQVSSDCHDTNTPICDQGSGSAHDTCRGCELNSECTNSNVCLASGVCVDADQVAYVLSTGSGAACTMASPCASIATAIELEPYVRILDSITESLVITKTVTLIGDAGVVLTAMTANLPTVTLTGTANVTLSRLEITGATMPLGDGVSATMGTTLDLDRVKVHDNAHMGVNAAMSTVTIDRSNIQINAYGGIDLYQSTYAITNTIVAGNGGGAALAIGGVAITQSTGTLIFSTIASNVGNAAVTGITCDAALAFADDIVYANAGGQASSFCTFTFSDVQGGNMTDGNMDMPPMLDSTYHLLSTSPVINQADTNATVPLDIDSQHRPQGSVRDMGADEFMQP
jgi:hypothetical protein